MTRAERILAAADRKRAANRAHNAACRAELEAQIAWNECVRTRAEDWPEKWHARLSAEGERIRAQLEYEAAARSLDYAALEAE